MKPITILTLIFSVLIFGSSLIIPEAAAFTIPTERPLDAEYSTASGVGGAIVPKAPTQTEPVTEPATAPDFTAPKHYTEDDAIMLAKLLWREARGVSGVFCGVSSKARQAAVVWCVLNRVDSGLFGNTIYDVVSAPYQFAYYPNTPVTDELLELAEDALSRWSMEKNGAVNVGRTLPKDYFFFVGDGEENHFRQDFNSTQTWDWDIYDPYL